MTDCGHYYCNACWSNWMTVNKSCPTCRKKEPKIQVFKMRESRKTMT